MEEKIINGAEAGTVKISENVICVISAIATNDITGIAGMASTRVEGFTNMLSGKKNLYKGVKVVLEDNKANIDIFVIVKYGVKIHEVCAQVQESVKKSVETMTGITIEEINVYVQDVEFPKVEEITVDKVNEK